MESYPHDVCRAPLTSHHSRMPFAIQTSLANDTKSYVFQSSRAREREKNYKFDGIFCELFHLAFNEKNFKAANKIEQKKKKNYICIAL
jgi:hypothetical protein